MSEFDLLATGARGMAEERDALEIAARNVAAAQAATPDHPFHRLVAAGPLEADDVDTGPESGGTGAEPALRESAEPADALTEMIAMLDAQRAYERSASLFDAGKRLIDRTLDVGRL